MLTPKFKLTQDDEYLYVDISISSIRFNASGLELVVDDTLFVFHLSPYYLRLRFPHPLVDDERCKAEYKAGDESIFVKIPKLNKGEIFEDLDLPTKLLARHGEVLAADAVAQNQENRPRGPLIQEISSSETPADKSTDDTLAAGEEFNWEIKQVPHVEGVSALQTRYGFDNQYDSVIGVSISNGNDINELDDPEHTSPNERVLERIRKENLKFDPEYYVSEFMTCKYGTGEDLDINGIKVLLQYVPPFPKQYLKWYKHAEDKGASFPVEFSPKEDELMRNDLPKKSYLIQDTTQLYVSILSLLFAHTFEQVENEGIHNTESAWTIGKLTPQLACLDLQLLPEELIQEFPIVRAALVAGTRRALAYPLHRNFDLICKCWNYVYYLLRAGKRLIIRALLDIYELFRLHDVYYVYNRVFLGDLCSWFISNGSENVTRSLAVELKKELGTLTKTAIDFDCVTGCDESGELTSENLTLAEMEFLAEAEYQKT
ncbi:AaceriADL230Cp [[Ashbya] aceris (nom. inval.)]|nr:AaceriADL230Cp [[Ashbya] aceris (nom. inval.)]